VPFFTTELGRVGAPAAGHASHAHLMSLAPQPQRPKARPCKSPRPALSGGQARRRPFKVSPALSGGQASCRPFQTARQDPGR
jgi:hypothetical protein